jgi:hypothetical protein
MLRVVADTNIYIPAFVFGGVAERVVRRAEQQRFLLYISNTIVGEVEEILTEKLGYSPDALRVVRRSSWTKSPKPLVLIGLSLPLICLVICHQALCDADPPSNLTLTRSIFGDNPAH